MRRATSTGRSTSWTARWCAPTSPPHVRAERGGKPVVFALTAGERNEQLALPSLLERGAVRRPGRGRPRLRPDRIAGDKGYSSRTVRRYLRRRAIGAVIPRRRDEPPQATFDREA